VWIGPNINDMSCLDCTFGFVANLSDPAQTCVLPPFGVRPGAWDRAAYEAAASFGRVDPVSGRQTLFLRSTVAADAPSVATNPKQSFVGFSSSNYMGIRCVCLLISAFIVASCDRTHALAGELRGRLSTFHR
jgi:hypothetical protein